MKYVSILILLLCCTELKAQFIVKGTVTDNTGKSVEGLVIRMLAGSNQQKKSYSLLSEKNGTFEFKLPEAGVYSLICNSSFYRDTIISNISITQKETLLSVIILTPVAVVLKGVEVTAKKKIFESDAGKRVYNVSADPTVAGLSGVETINNIPGITATEDGPVLFRGSSEAVVLVNGRRVPGTPGQYLAQLPSHSIEKIEVSNNTTQFNAQNDGVVVHIILKQAALNEWRAFFSTQFGYPLKQINSFSLLHNRKNFEFTFDVGTTLHHHPSESFYDRKTVNGSNNILIYNSLNNTAKHFTRRAQFGFTWKPDSTISYTVSLYGQLWPDKSVGNFNRTTTENGSITNDQKNIYRSVDNYDNSFVEFQQMLRKKFSKKLTAAANFDISRNTDATLSQTMFTTPYTANDFNKRNRTELRTELIYTLKENSVIKIGGQFTKNIVDAGADFTEGNNKDNYQTQTDYKVRAAYALAEIKPNQKFYFNPGLRYEYFSVDAAINGVKKTNVQTTAGIFPTLIAGYKHKGHEWRIVLRRSIRRPSVFDLIPVSSLFSNKYDQTEVNLAVFPAFTNNAELSYSRDFEKMGRLDINVFARFVKNEFANIFAFTPTGNSSRKWQNIGRSRSFGFDINYTIKYFKTITSNINVILTSGRYNSNQLYTNSALSSQVDLNNTIQLSSRIHARLRFLYVFAQQTIWGKNEAMTVAGGAISYQFKNKRATFTADISDIFLDNISRGTRYVPGGYETFSNWWDTRVCRIGLTYRFGKLNKEVKSNLRGE